MAAGRASAVPASGSPSLALPLLGRSASGAPGLTNRLAYGQHRALCRVRRAEGSPFELAAGRMSVNSRHGSGRFTSGRPVGAGAKAGSVRGFKADPRVPAPRAAGETRGEHPPRNGGENAASKRRRVHPLAWLCGPPAATSLSQLGTQLQPGVGPQPRGMSRALRRRQQRQVLSRRGRTHRLPFTRTARPQRPSPAASELRLKASKHLSVPHQAPQQPRALPDSRPAPPASPAAAGLRRCPPSRAGSAQPLPTRPARERAPHSL